jgi:hypothetical protein
MMVHYITDPKRRPGQSEAADRFLHDDGCDDEDAATELWVSTAGCDIRLSAIELLIVTGMLLPPANEG